MAHRHGTEAEGEQRCSAGGGAGGRPSGAEAEHRWHGRKTDSRQAVGKLRAEPFRRRQTLLPVAGQVPAGLLHPLQSFRPGGALGPEACQGRELSAARYDLQVAEGQRRAAEDAVLKGQGEVRQYEVLLEGVRTSAENLEGEQEARFWYLRAMAMPQSRSSTTTVRPSRFLKMAPYLSSQRISRESSSSSSGTEAGPPSCPLPPSGAMSFGSMAWSRSPFRRSFKTVSSLALDRTPASAGLLQPAQR